MWKMNKEGSDVDLFRCYIMGSENFFLGTRPNNHQYHIDNIDRVTSEIGVVITQLKKGNINYLWNVMSPLVEEDWTGHLHMLRYITKNNLSKQTYHSIRGMSVHNIKHFLERKKYDVDFYKKMNVIGRTIKFGIRLFETGKLVFEPFYPDTKDQLIEMLVELEEAWNNSKLPKKPDPEPFNKFLIGIRKWKIREDERDE